MGHSGENRNSNLLNIKELKPDLTVNLASVSRGTPETVKTGIEMTLNGCQYSALSRSLRSRQKKARDRGPVLSVLDADKCRPQVAFLRVPGRRMWGRRQ
jgi:hypothetical protein